MAMMWRELRREHGMIALATDGASLILEAPRAATTDSDLSDAIARLAPHLTFGAPRRRGAFIERDATSGDERIVIGRYARGAITVAYLVSSREPIDIDDVIAAHAGDDRSPFDHFVD